MTAGIPGDIRTPHLRYSAKADLPTAEVTGTRKNEHQLRYGGKASFLFNHPHLTEVNNKQLAVSDLASYVLRKSELKDSTGPDENNTKMSGS